MQVMAAHTAQRPWATRITCEDMLLLADFRVLAVVAPERVERLQYDTT